MVNSFSKLIEALSVRVPMRLVKVDVLNRIARFVPESDSKERILCWRGADPDLTELQQIIDDLVAHLEL